MRQIYRQLAANPVLQGGEDVKDKSENLLYTIERDKDVSEKKWWLDQRAQLAEAIDNAKKC